MNNNIKEINKPKPINRIYEKDLKARKEAKPEPRPKDTYTSIDVFEVCMNSGDYLRVSKFKSGAVSINVNGESFHELERAPKTNEALRQFAIEILKKLD